MNLDYETLDLLKQSHPAWRLLRSDTAPLAVSFFNRVFLVPNVRIMAQLELVEALEDELFSLRKRFGEEIFPRVPLGYLNDWASNDKGWLRKFYVSGSDEPHYDLTPSTEKAVVWLSSLTERPFVGTESRLLTLFELLSQMFEGSETDPDTRIAMLIKHRAEIDHEIERIQAGDISLLDNTAIKDRFQQFTQLANELLTDFREVEHNFRALDRRVREQIALWEGSKGTLLEEIMGERDAIADSDQGKSFHAFWDFLMSQRKQEELTRLLDRILILPAVQEMHPDPRLRRVHHNWLEAGEQTQRTVSQLSQQLRRFLDDQTWLENRRIMEILHSIETTSLAILTNPPKDSFMEIPESTASIQLPAERPLFRVPVKPEINDILQEDEEVVFDLSMLFAGIVIDKTKLLQNINLSLQTHSQITVSEIVSNYPLKQGLAELVSYLQLASERKHTVVDEETIDIVQWETNDDTIRRVSLPRIILTRN